MLALEQPPQRMWVEYRLTGTATADRNDAVVPCCAFKDARWNAQSVFLEPRHTSKREGKLVRIWLDG